jgi:HPt (histidine-containing phosphotransfer) domain-containing protein
MAELDARLAQVWAEHRGEIRERIDTIDAAIAALATGVLDEDARRTAARAAHRLAGTAGTFGFAPASEHAAALDLGLRTPPVPGDAAALARLALALRGALDLGDKPATDAGPTMDRRPR